MDLMNTLFDTSLPDHNWTTIPTAGFNTPIPGVLFRTTNRPCCGLPLGGVGTGCVDIDPSGVWGYNSTFNGYTFNPDGVRMPRVAPTLWPMFGLATGGQVWVLATQEVIQGGQVPYCTEPMVLNYKDQRRATKSAFCQVLKNVKPVQDIVYFGHYPIADLEYLTDAPISVGLRAWAPFIPGDALTSNLPGAVFEVHLRNRADQPRHGTLAFNFAGPSAAEAMSGQFLRTPVNEKLSTLANVNGLLVSALGSSVSYCMAALDENVRTGAGLNRHPYHWADIANRLPFSESIDRDGGGVVTLNSDASLAVDFDLPAGGEKVVRFVLAWYAPFILGSPKDASQLDRLKHSQGGELNTYTSMYATRFRSALEVARHFAANHEALLERVLAWQRALYAEERLPVWLREQLVSTLALMAEDSYWVQGRPPIDGQIFPNGVFGLNESPRDCPHIENIPSSFYGNPAVVCFFPELSLTSMRLFKEYQREDGNIPFELGAVLKFTRFCHSNLRMAASAERELLHCPGRPALAAHG